MAKEDQTQHVKQLADHKDYYKRCWEKQITKKQQQKKSDAKKVFTNKHKIEWTQILQA